jgi:hypothetical protein
MKLMIIFKKFKPILLGFSLILITFNNVGSEINETKAKKIGVPFKDCIPEKGVTFKAGDGQKLTTNDLESLLIGNTLLSVDRYGTFAIYYPEKGVTVGWMPKLKSEGYEWTKGNVTFANDKYCRTWKEWRSGKKINCWEASRGEDHFDKPGFYFTCKNGIPDGDVHIVFQGNVLDVKYKGNGAKSGKLTQNDTKAKEYIEKYFAKYVNK